MPDPVKLIDGDAGSAAKDLLEKQKQRDDDLIRRHRSSVHDDYVHTRDDLSDRRRSPMVRGEDGLYHRSTPIEAPVEKLTVSSVGRSHSKSFVYLSAHLPNAATFRVDTDYGARGSPRFISITCGREVEKMKELADSLNEVVRELRREVALIQDEEEAKAEADAATEKGKEKP